MFSTAVKVWVIKSGPFFFSDAKRKLRYVGKDGFDIFRNVKLFAVSVKWEGLEEIVEDVVKAAAVSYEEAFNSILFSVQSNNNFKQVSQLKL